MVKKEDKFSYAHNANKGKVREAMYVGPCLSDN